MVSTKPYLIRAVRDWALDNNLTPHLIVDMQCEGTLVPEAYTQDDRLTLNISEQAVRDLQMGNEWLMFFSRFGGQDFAVEIPVEAVVAIFARENGEGIAFAEEGSAPDEPPDSKVCPPHLRVVK
ncbi:MAG TPA: ClpXP protease specificity-enhancing factor [Acidiferrobacteraceae bacterium]|nr:ClpXP protease specificity-enhancing factor [Acidiferrobacteraceae bacterium]